MPPSRTLFLVGFMGSGKSTVGARLAARLGRELVDTDERIVEREGRTIDRIFVESGEGYFRKVETELLHELQGRGPLIVATGGGLFLGAQQRRFMNGEGLTVWLDAAPEVLLRRVRNGAGRPLWPGEDRLNSRAFLEKRRAVYALAALRVDTTGIDPEKVARIVLEKVSRLESGRTDTGT